LTKHLKDRPWMESKGSYFN